MRPQLWNAGADEKPELFLKLTKWPVSTCTDKFATINMYGNVYLR